MVMMMTHHSDITESTVPLNQSEPVWALTHKLEKQTGMLFGRRGAVQGQTKDDDGNSIFLAVIESLSGYLEDLQMNSLLHGC